ncbi:hypothetical protein CC85DRAFT_288981 [Cutaneotrichosporon oleaginosum]|uniref:Uncharacterized protein n=1 Tax=Cutaneotrichosporon oleaginosum TaxID=879819 RepID=A0A0J0XD88_9TREE|nr:uncharacterized protein CC85DRAFT_288981 [Cutaneotrichosporon oleaginosum]KLT39008.1 hypothetical protein CC85DRAFT_288981 [Cutaneotrichosporon oleaginosum]TXT08314.1 hypothetical protein COLE_05238 [Cutaneotrichosporon oleaginosum]
MLRWSRLSRWRPLRPSTLQVRGVRNRPHVDKKRGTTFTEVIDGREVERTIYNTPEELAEVQARARREIEALLANSRVELEDAEGDDGGEEGEDAMRDGVTSADDIKTVHVVDGRAVEVERRSVEEDEEDGNDADYSPSPNANYTVRKEKHLVHGQEVETEIYTFPAPGQSVREMDAEERIGDETSSTAEEEHVAARTVPATEPPSDRGGASAEALPGATMSLREPAPVHVEPGIASSDADSPYRYSSEHDSSGYDIDINIDIEGDNPSDYTVEIEIEPASEPYIGPHGTAIQHQRWMERHLSAITDGERTSDVSTPLRAAHEFLDGQAGNMEERSEAYWRFLREFLKHPLGGRPALDLVRRQAAEGVPFTVAGAITAFKAARNFRPVLRELLPILPAEMTTELIYIFAVALVNEQRVSPDAVRELIGQSLAAVRGDERGVEGPAGTLPDASFSPSGAQNAASAQAAPFPHAMRTPPSKTRAEVATIEWSPELFFPVILAHVPHADFRGVLRTLNDLRAAVRLRRERTIAAGGAWPGENAQAITKCYTAVMSLWLRSQLAEEKSHLGRVGRRLGSAVPHRLAVDLGNLLAPAAGVSAPEAGGSIVAAAAEPILALDHALDAADTAAMRDEKYHFRYPFLSAWFNAERVAGNVGIASGVWALLSGQSIAASVAGLRPPRTPTAEAYVALFRLLRQYPPASYRPVASTVLEGEVTTEVLNMMLSAASFVPKRARTDWAALSPPWDPPGRQPFPAPAHVPSPDLPLIFVLAEEHTHLMNHQSVNILCAALLRAARIITAARGAEHPVLLSAPESALTMAEWKWLEQSLWATEMAEAQRTNRAAHKPPPIPVDAADLWDTERWRGQMAEGEGRARWLLVDHVVRPLRRQLVESMIDMARLRGEKGSNAEVFTAELRTLQAHMRPLDSSAVGEDRARALAEELGLVVPPPAFVKGRKDKFKKGKGRRAKGLTRSAANKSALDNFFAMMDEE